MRSGSDMRWTGKYKSSPYPLHEGDSISPIVLPIRLYSSFSDYMGRRYAVSRRRENQRGWMRDHILLNSDFTIFLNRTYIN
jgi:hypothetical protein